MSRDRPSPYSSPPRYRRTHRSTARRLLALEEHGPRMTGCIADVHIDVHNRVKPDLTTLHGTEKIERTLATDPELRGEIAAIRAHLAAG